MITITLRLSESLLSIFRDAGSPWPETLEIRVPPGTTVREILAGRGINPLLVPMASFKTDRENKRVDMSAPLSFAGTLILYGPLAGG